MEELLIQIAGALLPVLLPKLAQAPAAVTAITDVVGALKKTTAPAATSSNSTASNKPSEFVRYGQHLINQYLKPATPLAEDGWLGKKTEAAIVAALAPYGIVIPIDA